MEGFGWGQGVLRWKVVVEVGGGGDEGGEGWGGRWRRRGRMGWMWEEFVSCEGLLCVAWSLVNRGLGGGTPVG